jgi:hypothetical protein
MSENADQATTDFVYSYVKIQLFGINGIGSKSQFKYRDETEPRFVCEVISVHGI